MASDSEAVHTLVVGTGAVGGFYGSRLHQPDRKRYVSFVCRSNYDQIAAEGLRIESRSLGDHRVSPFKVFRSVQDAAQEVRQGTSGIKAWKFVLLATKLFPDQVDDSRVLEPLFLGGHETCSTLVLMQNGIGFEHVHRRRFPQLKILSAVTVLNAGQSSPGVITHNRWTRISMGPYFNFEYLIPKEEGAPVVLDRVAENLEKESHSSLELFVELLRDGGIRDAESYSEKSLQLLRWHKLAINSSMNPTSVLCGGLTNTEMVTRPHLRHHLKETMNEVLEAGYKIFDVTEYPSKFASPEEILQSQRSGRQNEDGVIKSSMLTDWENHKPLEIEAILGFPIKIAKQVGIQLHRVEAMYALLLELINARNRSSLPDKLTRL